MTLMKYGTFCFQPFVLTYDKSLSLLVHESEIGGIRLKNEKNNCKTCIFLYWLYGTYAYTSRLGTGKGSQGS
jgi:hypothetical protein